MVSVSSCHHPLKAFHVGWKDNGKKLIKVMPYETDYLMFDGKSYVSGKGTIDLVLPRWQYFTEYSEIPCGHCLACRMRNSRQWADRMVCEASVNPPSFFITLTYDDAHVPIGSGVDQSTGEVIHPYTLDKVFFQKFMKRLRKAFPDDRIRFFACGEYGDKYKRPHYHLITFGLHLDDLVPFKKTWHGDYLYHSSSLEKVWSEVYSDVQLGFVVVSPANWQTMAYVSRYVTKKLGKTSDVNELYKLEGREPEFALMSRKPGLGADYFHQHPEIFDYDCFYVEQDGQSSKKIFHPEYFLYLKAFEDPGFVDDLKASNVDKLKNQREQILSDTDKDYLSVLEDEELVLQNKNKKLLREVF